MSPPASRSLPTYCFTLHSRTRRSLCEKQFQFASLKAEDEEVTTTARNLMRAALYPGHPYSLRLNGSPATVPTLTRDQVAGFYRQYAVAKNGVIAIFGDVKAAEVKTLVERLFAAMPAGEDALTNPPAPPPLAASATVEEHRNKAQAILMVAYRGADMFSPDRPVLELIDEACSDLGSRLFVRIRENMGLAYFVGSSQLLGLVPGPFAFYLGTSPQKLDAVQAELLDEIDQLAKQRPHRRRAGPGQGKGHRPAGHPQPERGRARLLLRPR